MTRANATRYRGSVRIGPISLLVFVIILCISVMAMLALSTAKASTAFTDRQASFTQDIYQNERAAQLLVSEVDSALSQGGEANLREKLTSLTELVRASEDSQVTTTLLDDGTLDATFETDNGRVLVVQMTTTDNGYTITKWHTDTDWKADDSVKLWQG